MTSSHTHLLCKKKQKSSRLSCQLAEEYAIHDYEGFDGYPVGEYEGISALHEIACFIEEHPGFAGELISQFNGNGRCRAKCQWPLLLGDEKFFPPLRGGRLP